MLGDVVEDGALIFNDRRECKNGNTLGVRTVFEEKNDVTIYIPSLTFGQCIL